MTRRYQNTILHVYFSCWSAEGVPTYIWQGDRTPTCQYVAPVMATRCQLTANYPFSMSAKCQQLLIRVPVIPCGLVNMPWCARTGPKSAQFCQHWALRGNDWGWNPILLCNNLYTHVLCGGWGYTGFLLFICPLSVFCSSLCDLGRYPDDKSFHQILKNFGTYIIWVKILEPWIRAFTFGTLRPLKVIPDISPRFCQILIFVVFWIFLRVSY